MSAQVFEHELIDAVRYLVGGIVTDPGKYLESVRGIDELGGPFGCGAAHRVVVVTLEEERRHLHRADRSALPPRSVPGERRLHGRLIAQHRQMSIGRSRGHALAHVP